MKTSKLCFVSTANYIEYITWVWSFWNSSWAARWTGRGGGSDGRGKRGGGFTYTHTLLSQMQHISAAQFQMDWSLAPGRRPGVWDSCPKEQVMSCFGLVGLFWSVWAHLKSKELLQLSQSASYCGVHSSFPSALCCALLFMSFFDVPWKMQTTLVG